jgi:hypothetical protein
LPEAVCYSGLFTDEVFKWFFKNIVYRSILSRNQAPMDCLFCESNKNIKMHHVSLLQKELAINCSRWRSWSIRCSTLEFSWLSWATYPSQLNYHFISL